MKRLLVLTFIVVMLLSLGIVASAIDLEQATAGTEDELSNALSSGKYVVLTDNVVVNGTITIPHGVESVLDLNGYYVTYVIDETVSANTFLIENNGILTVKSTGEENQICLTYNGANVAYTISTIGNFGTINVEGGAIINCENGNQNISYAIDNLCSKRTATINVNGGKVVGGVYGYCIRLFANSTKNDNVLNVKDGEIWYVFAQGSVDYAARMTINVTGGLAYYVCLYSGTGETVNCEKISIKLLASASEYGLYVDNVQEGYRVEERNGYYTLEHDITLEEIFSFMGVSTRENGSGITVGYGFDKEAYELYCIQNETTLDFGTHFAVSGKAPLQSSLSALAVSAGQFNVIVTGLNDSHLSLVLEMALYINCKDGKKYATANGVETAITATYRVSDYYNGEVNA